MSDKLFFNKLSELAFKELLRLIGTDGFRNVVMSATKASLRSALVTLYLISVLCFTPTPLSVRFSQTTRRDVTVESRLVFL